MVAAEVYLRSSKKVWICGSTSRRHTLGFEICMKVQAVHLEEEVMVKSASETFRGAP